MKKNWEMPRTVVQKFEPNEYVAACVTGTIQCAIPGRSAYDIGDGTSSTNFNYMVYYSAFQLGLWDSNGPVISADGQDHGICGEATSITFSDVDGSGSGYEMNHGVLDYSRPISNISGYSLKEGTYNVVWNSTNGYSNYNHYGTLTITNIDNSRPNHS